MRLKNFEVKARDVITQEVFAIDKEGHLLVMGKNDVPKNVWLSLPNYTGDEEDISLEDYKTNTRRDYAAIRKRLKRLAKGVSIYRFTVYKLQGEDLIVVKTLKLKNLKDVRKAYRAALSNDLVPNSVVRHTEFNWGSLTVPIYM